MGIPLYVEPTIATPGDASPNSETPDQTHGTQDDQHTQDDHQPVHPSRASLLDLDGYSDSPNRRNLRRTAVEILAARTSVRNYHSASRAYNPRYPLPASTRPDRIRLRDYRMPEDFLDSGHGRNIDVDTDHDSDTEILPPITRPRRRIRAPPVEFRSIIRRDRNNLSDLELEDWTAHVVTVYRPRASQTHDRTFPNGELR